MTIPQLHMYDLKTGEYTGSRDATRRPNGEYMLEATGATPVALPADIPAGHIARWTGDAWEGITHRDCRMWWGSGQTLMSPLYLSPHPCRQVLSVY